MCPRLSRRRYTILVHPSKLFSCDLPKGWSGERQQLTHVPSAPRRWFHGSAHEITKQPWPLAESAPQVGSQFSGAAARAGYLVQLRTDVAPVYPGGGAAPAVGGSAFLNCGCLVCRDLIGALTLARGLLGSVWTLGQWTTWQTKSPFDHSLGFRKEAAWLRDTPASCGGRLNVSPGQIVGMLADVAGHTGTLIPGFKFDGARTARLALLPISAGPHIMAGVLTGEMCKGSGLLRVV